MGSVNNSLSRCQELFSDRNQEAAEVSGCREEVLVSNMRKDKQIQEQRGRNIRSERAREAPESLRHINRNATTQRGHAQPGATHTPLFLGRRYLQALAGHEARQRAASARLRVIYCTKRLCNTLLPRPSPPPPPPPHPSISPRLLLHPLSLSFPWKLVGSCWKVLHHD